MTQIKAKLPLIGDEYYGNPSKRFRFKGKVPTFTDLPNTNGRVFNGDTYYVIDEDETYFFDEGEFKKVEINIEGGSSDLESRVADLENEKVSKKGDTITGDIRFFGDVEIHDAGLILFAKKNIETPINPTTTGLSLGSLSNLRTISGLALPLDDDYAANKKYVDESVLFAVVEENNIPILQVAPNNYTKIDTTTFDTIPATKIEFSPSRRKGFIGEYLLEIKTHPTIDYTYVFPKKIIWANPISFEKGKTYVISILNNVALWTSFETK